MRLCGRRALRYRPLNPADCVKLSDYATADTEVLATRQANDTAITNAIAAAVAAKKPLYIGSASHKDVPVKWWHAARIDTASAEIIGAQSTANHLIGADAADSTKPTTGMRITGTGSRVWRVGKACRDNTVRESGSVQQGHHSFCFFQTARARVEVVHAANAPNVGVFSETGTDGFIGNPLIANCKADAIHFTVSSKRMKLYGGECLKSGDDGLAVVSYGYTSEVSDILAVGYITRRSAARGLTVVGGKRVKYLHCEAWDSVNYPALVISDGTYGTTGVRDVTLFRPKLMRGGATGVVIVGRSGSQGNGEAQTVERVKVLNPVVRDLTGSARGFSVQNYTKDIETLAVDISGVPSAGFDCYGFNNWTVSGAVRRTGTGGFALGVGTTYAGKLAMRDLLFDSINTGAGGSNDAMNLYVASAAVLEIDVRRVRYRAGAFTVERFIEAEPTLRGTVRDYDAGGKGSLHTGWTFSGSGSNFYLMAP